MSETEGRAPRVGVRELRQNLSVYLRRVKTGETLDVTEHGHVVARLSPSPAEALSPYERLVADGRLTQASGDVLDRPPLDLGPGPSVTDVLMEMRAGDER